MACFLWFEPPGPAGRDIPSATLSVQAASSIPSTDLPTASLLREVLGNRSRLIQVTLLVVCLGIFILSWGKQR
jgi:hypothetical protein